ncbi:MAG: replication-relaxation family protein [Anaerolineae bacterium]|nr:replication-relaxation family protein [Anaerolineae bacterium]
MKRLPHFERATEPPTMVFTPRDKDILEAIYHHEGVLADYQIERLFFDSTRRMKARMSLLYHNGYVNRLSRQQRNSYGFMAYFLDEKGIDYLASVRGVLPKDLRARAKDERTSLIRHDVKLNDVRIAVMAALENLPDVEVVEWVNSRTFWADHDTVTYQDKDGKRLRRNIRPDAYFYIVLEGRRQRRMLLELDMRTEHNKRFVDEKIRPGLAYIASEAYKDRFGANAGQWLVVTTGEERLANMKRHAEQVGNAARAFYFTTFDEATSPGAFFTQPIWQRATIEEPVALFDSA